VIITMRGVVAIVDPCIHAVNNNNNHAVPEHQLPVTIPDDTTVCCACASLHTWHRHVSQHQLQSSIADAFAAAAAAPVRGPIFLPPWRLQSHLG
jgi:hypothetical protein